MLVSKYWLQKRLNLLKRNEYGRRPGKGANEDERNEEII